MKFIRQFSIFLIFFICLSTDFINASSLQITRRSKTSTTFKTKGPPSFADILNILNTLVKKSAENVLFLIFGVISEFVDGFDKVLDSFEKLNKTTKVTKELASCFTGFGAKKEPVDLSKSPFAAIEAKTGSVADKVKFCESFKENIHENYVKAEKEDAENNKSFWDAVSPDFLNKAVYSIGGKLASKEEFCKKPVTNKCPKLRTVLTKKFGSMKEYERQCLYFHSKDCDDFSPKTAGVKSFANDAYNYMSGLLKAGTCLNEKLSSNSSPGIIQAKAIIGKFFNAQDFVQSAMKGVLGTVANVLTGGLWGGVKGGYYLVKLVNKVNNFKANSVDHKTIYLVGKIIGNCIMIVKSILLGRRRRRLMRRRMR